jgi:hypothetical protein
LQDIIVASFTRNAVISFLQAEDGNFQAGLATYFKQFEFEFVGMFSGDFDGDKIIDLVAVSEQRHLSFLKGEGGGTFAFASSFEIPFSVGLLTVKSCFEASESSRFVLITEEVTGGRVPTFLFTSAPEKEFPFEMKFSTISLGDVLPINDVEELDEVRFGDFNGDGIQDLAILEIWHDRVFVATGTEDGGFAATQVVRTPKKADSVSTLDVNQDGRSDLFVTPMFPKVSLHSWIYTSAEDGSFKGPQEILTGVQVLDIAVGSFTRPGARQLAAANYNLAKVFVYDIAGNGTVSTEPIMVLRTQPSPAMLAVGRLNSDQIDDLVTPNESSESNSITLFLSH